MLWSSSLSPLGPMGDMGLLTPPYCMTNPFQASSLDGGVDRFLTGLLRYGALILWANNFFKTHRTLTFTENGSQGGFKLLAEF